MSIIKDVETKLPELFSLIPKTPVTVKPIPKHFKMLKFNNYQKATLDGNHEATFYADLSAPPFKPGMKTLLYHETIPGHHLQIAIAQDSK